MLGHRRAGACLASAFLFALVEFAAVQATALTECQKNRGGQECHPPGQTPYRYAVCDEQNASGAASSAWCRAAGGQMSGGQCVGATPRPRTEDDIPAYAQDFMRQFVGTVCAGPSTPAARWLAPPEHASSDFCYNSGPDYDHGWETGGGPHHFLHNPTGPHPSAPRRVPEPKTTSRRMHRISCGSSSARYAQGPQRQRRVGWLPQSMRRATSATTAAPITTTAGRPAGSPITSSSPRRVSTRRAS